MGGQRNRAVLPIGFDNHYFRLDVYQGGVGIYFLSEDQRPGVLSGSCLEKGFRGRLVSICRDEGTDEAIRETLVCRCPAQRTKQVVVYNRFVEVAGLERL